MLLKATMFQLIVHANWGLQRFKNWNNMAELESNLKCSICLELYNDPVALPCMHSFCRECLMEHVCSKSRSTLKDDAKVQTPCPNCKKLYSISKNIIRGMQRNFQLQSIVESYRRQHQKAGPPQCDMCKEKPADKRCSKCEVSYCPGCLKIYHPPTRTPFSTHNLTAVGGSFASGGGMQGAASGGASGGDSSGNAEAIKVNFYFLFIYLFFFCNIIFLVPKGVETIWVHLYFETIKFCPRTVLIICMDTKTATTLSWTMWYVNS